MWDDNQESMLDAIHDGTNSTLILTGPRGPLEIPCIYDSLKEERPVLENGGGKKIVMGTTLVVPLADENFEDYVGLTFKIGQAVKVKIHETIYDLRIESKVMDEVSFDLTLISVNV